MNTILIIIVLLILFGGLGGGYYGFSHYGMGGGIGTVSYTHLTLPTILLV